MNKETYEALKEIINICREQRLVAFPIEKIEAIESWIDEVAKEYEE
jgi:hypothetical protein